MTSKLNVFDHATKEHKKGRKWTDDGLIAMPEHVIAKLRDCKHLWTRNATYDSGESCITCSCSKGTWLSYQKYLAKQEG